MLKVSLSPGPIDARRAAFRGVFEKIAVTTDSCEPGVDPLEEQSPYWVNVTQLRYQ